MELYDTLSREFKEVPLGKVTIYTCGPTVYNYPHIGNWFTFIRYDLLVRTLKQAGFDPVWVLNITDVGHLVSDADEGEDKLEKGARREGKSAWEVADFYTDYFLKSLERLNFSQPNFLPRATQHIAEQIDFIKRLEEKDYIYRIDDGIYYDISKFPRYAEFARLDIDEQQVGARVEQNPQKKHPADFALWKFSPKDRQRDMEWDSPWGKGYPGWHIECSAMALKYLGETIDIHSGGIDHIPVHHTNEIAQSEALTGKPLARIWMHTNHILLGDKKFAKSANNSIRLEDLKLEDLVSDYDKNNSPNVFETLRLLVLESHYRTQSVFSENSFLSAYARLLDLRKFAQLQHQPNIIRVYGKLSRADIIRLREELLHSFQNDLNSPVFLEKLGIADSYIRREGLTDREALSALRELFKFVDDLTGLTISQQKTLTTEQGRLLREQDAEWAKAQKKSMDFTKSDTLRRKLFDEHRIIVSNYPDSGSLWSRF